MRVHSKTPGGTILQSWFLSGLLLCLTCCSHERAENSGALRDSVIRTNRENVHTETATPGSLDTMLGGEYDRMWELRTKLPGEFADTFAMQLEQALQNPASLHYPFDSLERAGCRLVTSDDRNVRLFCWSTPRNGTMTDAWEIIQYETDRAACVVRNMNPPGLEDGGVPMPRMLRHLRDSLYLLVSGGQLMGSMPYETACVIACTDTGVAGSDVSFEFGGSSERSVWIDMHRYLDHPAGGDSSPFAIRFDTIHDELIFPEIVVAATGEVYNGVEGTDDVGPSGRFTRLRFDGENFVNVDPIESSRTPGR